MDEYDIERAVLCALNNEETQAALRNYPHRFIGLVWVNPWNGNKALDEVKRYIEEEGFKGIKLHPLLHAFVANKDESAEKLT